MFFDRVAQPRPVYAPPDPSGRTEYRAGPLAQCDLWFPPVQLPVGFGQVPSGQDTVVRREWPQSGPARLGNRCFT